MPYIKKSDRTRYDIVLDQIGSIDGKGELEYCIFKLMRRYMCDKEERYSTLHDAAYAAAHCSDEFRRRFLDVREDDARHENGDIEETPESKNSKINQFVKEYKPEIVDDRSGEDDMLPDDMLPNNMYEMNMPEKALPIHVRCLGKIDKNLRVVNVISDPKSCYGDIVTLDISAPGVKFHALKPGKFYGTKLDKDHEQQLHERDE